MVALRITVSLSSWICLECICPLQQLERVKFVLIERISGFGLHSKPVLFHEERAEPNELEEERGTLPGLPQKPETKGHIFGVWKN